MFQSFKLPIPHYLTQPHIAYYIDGLIIFCSRYIVNPAIKKLQQLLCRNQFSIIRKLLLCSVTSPRIALAILVEQNAGFALFQSDFQILLSLMIDLHAFRKLEVPEARYSSFLKGTLRSSLLMSRISETLSNVTQRIVAKASRPKMDDTLLNRDISDNPSGMYSSET